MRRNMLPRLAGVSLMAHAILLRCLLLQRDGEVTAGLLTQLREWSMTREDVMHGLAELEAHDLVAVRWDDCGKQLRMVVSLLEVEA